ncbi:hypothetical protein OG474_38305 [Kribbella sp. NBC_01505]
MRTLTVLGSCGAWPEPGSDRSVSVAEARAEFGGEVIAATEGLTLRL